MRALAWLPGLALLPVGALLYFPEWLGLDGSSPWMRLAASFVAAGVAGAASARLDRATPPLRLGSTIALPVGALCGLLGMMMALEPEHVLLIAFGLASFVSCAALGAALARGRP